MACRAMWDEVSAGDPLAASGRYRVVGVFGRDAPAALQVLGRLRTDAFRSAGMGADAEVDLDRHDADYLQLLLLDDAERALIGGYRLGWCGELLEAHGPEGVYSTSLFDFDAPRLEQLRGAVEVGRSCIAPAYQRQLKTLALLWRAIGTALARRGGAHALFGSVSISATYPASARARILSTLREQAFDPRMATGIVARTPPTLPDAEAAPDLATLDRELREAHGMAVPVLVKKYARLGGRYVGFNVDHAFGGSIDALVWVDLRRTPQAVLEGYVGVPLAASLQGRA